MILGFPIYCDKCGRYMGQAEYSTWLIGSQLRAIDEAYNEYHECRRCRKKRLLKKTGSQWGFYED